MEPIALEIFQRLLANGTGIETIAIMFLALQLVGLRKATELMTNKLTEAIAKLDKRITILEVRQES